MPELICRCGNPLNAAGSPTTDQGPSPGDYSVCIYCGYLRAFGDDLKLRELTAAELDELMRDPEYTEMVQRMRSLVRTVGGARGTDGQGH